mmetsp:Transcript_11152/g.23988  ORF Transcript_11152/g.23988 Transcript_11152/m.23988 type:complete len:82 (+) Transcript_11152:59-304(+)
MTRGTSITPKPHTDFYISISFSIDAAIYFVCIHSLVIVSLFHNIFVTSVLVLPSSTSLVFKYRFFFHSFIHAFIHAFMSSL